MTTLTHIRWGSYMQYRGPWYSGEHHLPTVEPHESFERKVLQVITATEGGAFDAVNMYDRMIMTNGLIQWGDAGQYSVCDMLGAAGEASYSCLDPVRAHIDRRGYVFGKDARGRYRFAKNGDAVDTIREQQELYLAGSSGLEGEWNDEQKLWAMEWAVAIANVWDDALAREAQIQFTAPRLKWFAFKDAQATLWGADARDADQNIVEATRAMYLSFAANLPRVADDQLKALSTKAAKWSLDWMIELARSLTFGPKIAIFPHRWNKIRPHLERLWKLDLPDLSEDLRKWQVDTAYDPRVPLEAPHDIENALVYLGYDLGPMKSAESMRAAVMSFQQSHGLQVDGIVGPKTRAALAGAIKKAG